MFNSKKSINKHELKEHGIEAKLPICEICKFKSTSFRSLDRHMVVHTEEKKFSCDECGKQFKYKDSVGQHMISHQRILKKNLICKIGNCRKIFKSKQKFKYHRTKEHVFSKEILKYICKICDYDGRNSHSLAKHMVKHTKEKPYLCHECEKTFAWKEGLILHMKIHQNLYDYECDKCDKKFRQKGQFQFHNIVHHEKIFPTICPTCGEGFPTSTFLKRHMSIHTGEKKFKCTVCNKSFRLLGTQKKHELIHNDFKKFACVICPKRFRASDALKVHIKRHLNQKDYICQFCDIGFIEPAGLRRHRCLLS